MVGAKKTKKKNKERMEREVACGQRLPWACNWKRHFIDMFSFIPCNEPMRRAKPSSLWSVRDIKKLVLHHPFGEG